MTQLLEQLSHSSSLKLLTIGALALLLLIPTAMIDGVIRDRAHQADVARADIMNAWGRPQSLVGPILAVPYRQTVQTQHGLIRTATGIKYFLPEATRVDAQLDAQTRYRGRYTVPVYEASIRIDVEFPAIAGGLHDLKDATLDYARAELIIALDDPRTLRETPVAIVNGVEIPFGASSGRLERLGYHVKAPLTDVDVASEAISVNTTLRFAGTDSLRVAPVGDTSTIAMTSNWSSPSFQGPYLPAQRDVQDDGFTASWQVTSLGRPYSRMWTDDEVTREVLESSLFGVELRRPLDRYDLARRAVRYAILTIALTFACFFVFEIISALHLHPVQYLLVGFANCLFFLLLLSLSEYLGFVAAYVLSAGASVALVGGYAAAILNARSRAGVCTTVLVALYAFLFMTLRAENVALLTGSIGLWVVLGAVMYFTRRVDWHKATAARTTPTG